MKITFVGTGNMGSVKRCNTSVLVDDILFDIGMGTVKQMQRLQIYTKSIKYIVLSHFHADHLLDIPNFLCGRIIRHELDYLLTIIGPAGTRQKIIDLMNFTHGDGNPHKYDNPEERYNLEVVELNDGDMYENNLFKLTAFDLNHGKCKPINGYILEKDDKKIGYATDTTFCDNYYKICEECDYVISEVNTLVTGDMHIGLEDFINTIPNYPNAKFYVVHRGDFDTSKYDDSLFPDDGDIVEI